MLKDIFKVAKENGIVYKRGFFIYNDSMIPYKDFIKFVNNKRFISTGSMYHICGIKDAINNTKKELFNKQ